MKDALEERCFIKFICETGWTNNHKKCYRYGSEEGYTKKHVLNKCPVFELWKNIKYKTMNDYKIKQIRNILNDFYKDKKRYMKYHKIRHAVIKYKK